MTLKRVGDRPIQYQADTHSNLLDQAVFTVRSVNEAVWDGANQPVTAVLSNYELLFLLEGGTWAPLAEHQEETLSAPAGQRLSIEPDQTDAFLTWMGQMAP